MAGQDNFCPLRGVLFLLDSRFRGNDGMTCAGMTFTGMTHSLSSERRVVALLAGEQRISMITLDWPILNRGV
jgi:hypothetical protein